MILVVASEDVGGSLKLLIHWKRMSKTHLASLLLI